MPSHFPKMGLRQTVACYRGPKRARYESAAASLQRDPLTAKDALLSMFCKFEKIVLGKPARIISPRQSRYNLVLARYLKHAEKHFFRAINRVMGSRTRATVMKGLDVDQVAETLHDKWNCFNEPVAVGLDATKFDAHVQQTALRYEHSFYTSLYPWSRELRKLLSQQLVCNARAYCKDGRVRLTTTGRRASGDINTSLGNCIIMCALVFCYAFERNIRIELANNGDDCVVIMERNQLHDFTSGLESWFLTKGFRMVAEDPVYSMEEIEFCQMHPVLVGAHWRMVRNPTACIGKDLICLTSCPNALSFRRWLGVVGLGGAHLCDGVPVLQTFYDCVQRWGVSPREKFFTHTMNHTYFMQRKRTARVSSVTIAARASFYFATGILPDAQVAIERGLLNTIMMPPPLNVVLADSRECVQGEHLRLIYRL